MILLTGATGTSGSEIAKELLRRHVPFRALVRSAAKARNLETGGVELVEGDLDQPESLDRALEGIQRALILSAPDPRSVEQQGNFINASKRAGVKHIVKFSAMGAAINSPAFLLKWHGQIEEELQRSGIPFTALQPNSFMQNFLGMKATIAQGAIYAPMKQTPLTLVDTRDIAAVAATTLTEAGHEGRIYVITGPEALTHDEIAAKLSAALGHPVKYADVPLDAFNQSLRQAGLPGWLADWYH
ncbi:MAG: SDR family oxidoreductase [Bryobacteraceae bacterium]